MAHLHNHTRDHGHSHAPVDYNRAFAIGVALNLTFVVVEATYGFLAGVIILTSGWLWIDPVVSLIITAIILGGTWGLLRDSFNLALDAVSAGIDPEAVKSYLSDLPGVSGVHDLHIWAMSTSETALSAHLLKPDPGDDDTLIEQASRELHDRFGIEHITIQWERLTEMDHCGSFCEVKV
jgi:cobalt-zinc-cadmium efflux system protein